MRRLFLGILTIIALATACETFDATQIWDKLNEHEARIEELETLCRRLNTNVASLQSIVAVLQSNDHVTDIVKIMENGVEVGCSITFAKSGTVTLYHGANAAAPTIGVKKAASGEYYWTINGEWLTDENGSMISATVQDPSAGYITPQFRVADDIWYISYDNGNTWRPTEQASESFFQSVTYDQSNLYVTLSDGTSVTIPRKTSDKVTRVTLAASLASATHDGYILPTQTVGKPVAYGTHSSSYMFVIPAGSQVNIEHSSGGSYGFALCDKDDNVLEYTTNAANYSFETRYVETHLWASAPKLGTSNYTVTYKQPESNYWTGKTIWWCGTSIPAGGYPQLVGEMLGATVINAATGGSMCRANVRTGDYNGVNISNITSSLSMTLAEAEMFIENYSDIRALDKNSKLPVILDESYKNRMRQGSFEVKLMPYLDGTKPMPDLWIIDHGHNDWKYRDSKGNIDIALEPVRANIDAGELAEDTYMTETIDGVPYARLQSYLGSFENIDPAKLDDFVCSLNRNCYYEIGRAHV